MPSPPRKSISGDTFEASLREYHLTPTDFARLTGARTTRVHQWIIGDLSVPFWIPSWLELWRRATLHDRRVLIARAYEQLRADLQEAS